jgi:hypothetical protein
MSEKPLAVAHVDLDGTWAIFEANGHSYSDRNDPIFETGLPNLLDLFDRHGIKATLFTVAADARDPRKREMLAEAVRSGHEIASHTITHRRLARLPSSEKREEIVESRSTLESLLGTEVVGFRAPSYDVDRECLDILSESGYRYDSSVFPNRHFANRLRVPEIRGTPHRPFPGVDLVELPLPAYRPAPFPVHPSYSLILGRRYFSWGLRRFTKSKLPLVLLFHLTDVAEPLPADRLPSRKLKFMTLSHLAADVKLRRCDAMLNEVTRRYSWTDTSRLLRAADSPSAEP